MPSTYANLGASVADILSRASGDRSARPEGYSKGLDAGSQHMLRSAQSGQAMADTDKILYELSQARRGDQTTGAQIAEGMGVPSDVVSSLGRGETMRRPMPSASGPTRPTEAIPQAMTDKFTNANMLKVLQQLSGGVQSGASANTLADALLKSQEFGTRSNIQSGAQAPGDVATAEAALKGMFPGRTGAGGGSTASKVQEMNTLVARNKTLGMDDQQAHDAALLSIYGDPENEAWANAYQKAYQSTFSVKSAIKSANAAVERMAQKRGAVAAPPGNVVKVYK